MMSRSNLPCLLLALLALATSGCGALVVGGAGATPAGQEQRSPTQMRADAAITSSINTRYVQDDLVSAMAVKVDTYNGVVTLRGTLPSAQAVERAVALARATPDVTQVISRLSVTR